MTIRISDALDEGEEGGGWKSMERLEVERQLRIVTIAICALISFVFYQIK